MIYDKIENIDTYMGIGKNLDKALNSIKTNTFENSVKGRNDIDGENVYYNFVEQGETVPAEKNVYEAHKSYIDIHVDIKGGEEIRVSHISAMQPTTEYDAEGDYFLLKGDAQVVADVKPGYFCICFPSDAHMPMVAKNDITSKITKAIYKVKID